MGGDGGNSYDKKYNRGMLELSKEQQDWAREMYNQYKYGVGYDPNEMVADPNAAKIRNPDWSEWNSDVEKWIDDPSKMVTRGSTEGYDPDAQTSEMQYSQNVIEANQSLLGQRTEVEGAQLTDVMTAMKERAPVRTKFYDEALTGVDIGKRMDEAQASVEHGFKLSGQSARREAMSYGGLDPGKIASISSGINLEKAKTIAGARTTAKTLGEDEEFNRLRTAMTIM